MNRPASVQLRVRRSPRLIALGILLACLGGLGATFLYMQATQSQSVVVTTRHINRGETITAADVRAITVGTARGVSAIDGATVSSIVGKTARIDLGAHALVPSDAIGKPDVQAGMAQIGLALPAGRIPSEVVSSGTPIEVIEIVDGDTSPGRVFKGFTTSAPKLLPDGSVSLDVLISVKDAREAAVLAALGKVSVLRLADQ